MKTSAIPRPRPTAFLIILAAMAMATAFFLANAPGAGATGTPEPPANPLAHVIVPDGEAPKIRVSWDPPAGEVTGYAISRSDGETLQAAGTATTYSDLAVNPGTAYTYTVAARNGSGTSVPSAPTSARVPDPPSAPANMAATAASPVLADEAVTVAITWSTSSVPEAGGCETSYPLAGYTVSRVLDGTATELATPDAAATSFTDTSAAFNTAYTYRVTARNAVGNSPVAEVTVTTPVRPVGTATGLAASIADPFTGTVSLSWNAPTEGPAPTGYRVLRDGTELADNHGITSYTDSSAEAGVNYSYTVQARTADNIGAASAPATVEPPAPATGVTASVQDGTVSLSWTAPAQGTPGTYRIERAANGGDWTLVADTAQTSHADDTAPAGNTYTYRIQHRNSHGGSTWANSNSVTILDVPAKVEDVAASVSGNDIVLSWTAPTGTVDSYQVEYGPADSSSREAADVAATSFTHTDNTEGVTYRYKVRAKNSAGHGPWSEPAEAMRLNVPEMPTGLNAEVSGSVIIVSWTAPDSAGITGYEISYGDTTGMATGTEFIHEDPAGDTEYQYQVRALNDAGPGEWSGPVTAMRVIPAKMPTGVSADIVGDDIVLTWAAPASGIVDNYQVWHRQTETADWTREDVPADTIRYVHEGPTPGTTYEYQVRAINSGGPSDWTEPVSAVWYEGAAPPVMYKIRGLGKRFLVQWEHSVSEGVTGYQLRSRIDGGEWSATDLSATAKTQFVPWSSGQSLHEYTIRALIGDVAGNWSPIRRAVIAKHDPVTGVTANLESARYVRLHWDLPDNPPNLFIVEVENASGEFVFAAAAAGHESTALHYHQEYGTTREYRVRAKNHANVLSDIVPGSTVTVTTPEEPAQHDQQVRQLKLTMLDSATPKLSWKAPERSADRVTGYRIYRKEASDPGDISRYANIIAYKVGGTTYTDHAAQPGKSYEYAVMPYRRLTPELGPVSSVVYATTWQPGGPRQPGRLPWPLGSLP